MWKTRQIASIGETPRPQHQGHGSVKKRIQYMKQRLQQCAFSIEATIAAAREKPRYKLDVKTSSTTKLLKKLQAASANPFEM